MNFIDAVKELHESRCDAIMNKTLYGDRYYELDRGILSHKDSPVIIGWQTVLSEDWELVNPKPKYEEVEIVRYFDPELNIFYDVDLSPQRPNLIKLTGKMKCEIKPKVKKLVEVGFVFGNTFIKSSIKNAPLFAYVEE